MARRRRDRGGCLGIWILIGLGIWAMGGLEKKESWLVLALVVVVPLVLVLVLRGMWRAFALKRQRQRLHGMTLRDLDVLPGLAFEAWITAFLEDKGFACDNVKGSGDFGVDVIAELDGVRVGIQAKRYQGKVGNEAVQQAIAGSDFYHCPVAAVVTQSHFTRAAVRQAEGGAMPVILIDREGIMRMAATLAAAAREAGGAA